MVHRHPLYVVDAFTSIPFHGNPASVCLLRHDYPDAVLQAVASEMNHSETAFVTAAGGDLFTADRFSLRWFTPTTEVPLCGHATLASAKVLFDELGISTPSLLFDTLSGPIEARASGPRIEIELARHDPSPVAEPVDLRAALGGPPPEEVLEARELRALLVRYESETAVRALAPNLERLVRDLPAADLVIVTAPGSERFDFVSRCFAPRLGIAEDPVTGSAHTVLAPYWARIRGRSPMEAYQASPRGGELLVSLAGSDRVRIAGHARIVLRGYLDLPTSG
jgi:PhzF family phenazine biosynthesis protein